MTAAGTPLLASPSTVYYVYAGILAAGGVLIAAYALLHSGYDRRTILVASVPAIAMGIGYAMMGMELLVVTTEEGTQQSLARFLSYTVILLAIGQLIREIIGLTRRQFVKLLAVLVALPWTSLVSWIVPGIWNTLLTLGTIIAYLVVTYVLFKPVNRLALGTGGERWLLYAKLRNLLVLTYGVLVITSAASEQALGLTDKFVAQVGAGYTDLVLMYGIAFLVISSLGVFRQAREAQEEMPEIEESPQSGAAAQVD